MPRRMSNKFARFFSRFQLKAPVHYYDSLITWLLGVVSGMQDMAQAMDAVHCKVPDYYIHKATTCACGDDAVQIPEERRTEGVKEHAHWCTGTLKMLDGYGTPLFVYNPYTFQELFDMVEGMDAYLRCLSKLTQGGDADSVHCSDIEPMKEFQHTHGVSAISVFQKCKANYQQKQWDDGAYMAYDTVELGKHLPFVTPLQGSVGDCLLRAEREGNSNLGCVQDFTRDSGVSYWRYESLNGDPGSYDSRHVDACIVFSGPAKHPDTNVASEFKKCSNGHVDTGCKIPHMVWSTGSRNRVPVANLHMVADTTPEGRERVANAHFHEAHAMAMRSLDALQEFSDDNLEVDLFSGEGDSLHQIFDCIMQGPYSRVDFWTDGAEVLPKPPPPARLRALD